MAPPAATKSQRRNRIPQALSQFGNTWMLGCFRQGFEKGETMDGDFSKPCSVAEPSKSEDSAGGFNLVLFEITVYLILVSGVIASANSPGIPLG
jgi:hypothetical protein